MLFVQRVDDPENLEENFTEAEINNIIKALSNDKSPGTDGFNNEFLKKCWLIIKSDFYKLCHHTRAGDGRVTSLRLGPRGGLRWIDLLWRCL